jgi:hypothetical protein
MEASDGIGNVVAYRYRQGVFITSLNLGQSGVLPLLEFEVCTAGTAGERATRQVFSLYGGPDEAPGSSYFLPGWPATTAFPSVDGTSLNFEAYQSNGPFSNLATVVPADPDYDVPAATPFAIEFYIRTDVSASAGSGLGTFSFARHEITATDFVGSFTSDELWTFKHFNSVMRFTCPSIMPTDVLTAPLTLEVWNKFRVERNGTTLTLYKDDVAVDSAVVTTGAVAGSQRVSVNGPYQTFSPLPDHWGQGTYNEYSGLKIFIGGATFTPGTVDLADIVAAECLRVDLVRDVEIDVSDLVGIPVRGFQSSGSVVAAISSLSPIFHFGSVCSDKWYFRLQGKPSVRTLAFRDLAAGEDKAADEPFATETANDLEIAQKKLLTYLNQADDYAAGTESGSRNTESSVVDAISTNVVMIPSEAKAAVEVIAAVAGISALTGQISLTDYHVELEPTDAFQVPDQDGNLYRMRSVRETFGGGLHGHDLIRDDTHALVASGITNEDYTQSLTVAIPDVTAIVQVDTAQLRDADNDPGYYALREGRSARLQVVQQCRRRHLVHRGG